MTQFLLLAGLLDEQPQSTIFGLIVTAFGVWPLLGAALNLKAFMDTLPVPLLTAIIGRQATRVFFFVVGLLLIGLGLAIALGLLADDPMRWPAREAEQLNGLEFVVRESVSATLCWLPPFVG